MSRDKTIALIGVSDEEAAHLRLLMRKSASALDHSWNWGDEKHADLLVIDLRSFAGQMARTRALASGVRCAIFSDAPVAAPDLHLRRPLLHANVVEVLNQVGAARGAAPLVGAHSDDFYTRDLDEDAADPLWPLAEDAPTRSMPEGGLDELLRSVPTELRGAAYRPGPQAQSGLDLTPDRLTLEPVKGRAPAPSPGGDVRPYPARAGLPTDTAPHSLRAWLEQDLLRAPAWFGLPGAPPLALDPKHQVAHAPGGLVGLAPYCHAKWALADWRPLTSAELAELRATQSTLPYARLVWLDVLQHSAGQLARHLDPGGTYRLTQWVEIDRDLGRYFRIASVMLQPMRLHEIAAASGAPMADVFDLVNAYDAVGLIEWQPRTRAAVEAPASPSLLQRLRRPFGKS